MDYTAQIGDRVTVFEWLGSRDNSYKGDVLEVMAVDTPFVIVRRKNRYTGRSDRFSLDLRRVVLKPVSMAYEAELLTMDAEPGA